MVKMDLTGGRCSVNIEYVGRHGRSQCSVSVKGRQKITFAATKDLNERALFGFWSSVYTRESIGLCFDVFHEV